jgi:hypothetical protein
MNLAVASNVPFDSTQPPYNPGSDDSQLTRGEARHEAFRHMGMRAYINYNLQDMVHVFYLHHSGPGSCPVNKSGCSIPARSGLMLK